MKHAVQQNVSKILFQMFAHAKGVLGMRENFSRKNSNDSSGHYHLPATHVYCATQPVWHILFAQTKNYPKMFWSPRNFDHPTFFTPPRFVNLKMIPNKCSTHKHNAFVSMLGGMSAWCKDGRSKVWEDLFVRDRGWLDGDQFF